MPFIEEQMTAEEYHTGCQFLGWVKDNSLTFGADTIDSVFGDWLTAPGRYAARQ